MKVCSLNRLLSPLCLVQAARVRSRREALLKMPVSSDEVAG